MRYTKYTGARYVVKIYENSVNPLSADWEVGKTYEALTLVTYQKSTYLSKKPVPSTVGAPTSNPQYWTLTGYYNGYVSTLQKQIDDLNSLINTITNDIDNIELELSDVNTKIDNLDILENSLKGNLLLNDIIHETYGYGQGSCYIGNNKIVTYYSKTGNIGQLKCYNLSTYTAEWDYAIEAYHGNSITYNKSNNRIYICAALDSSYNPINKIIEIDLSHPNVIENVYTLPITSAFSATYDDKKDCFYVNSSNSQMITVFNNDFSSILDTFPINTEVYNIMTIGDAQGLNAVKDGKIYIPTSNERLPGIIAYDVYNNKLLGFMSIEKYINGCRNIGELENVCYDFDNDRFIVSSMLVYTGIRSYYASQYFEVSLNKNITPISLHCLGGSYGFYANADPRYIYCVCGSSSLKPIWLDEDGAVNIPNDGLVYSIRNGVPVRLVVVHSRPNHTELTYELSNLQLEGFNGRIDGVASNDPVKIHHCALLDYSNISFLDCEFDTFEDSGEYYNVYLNYNSKAVFQDCTFDDLGASGTRYHVQAWGGGHATLINSTFVGTSTADYNATNGGTIEFVS